MVKATGVIMVFLLYAPISFAALIDASDWGARMWTNQLLFCVSKGSIKGCEQALSRGAQVNKKDERGRTPLMWAVHHRYPKIVKLLLEKKARVNLKDDRGRTALHRASSAGFKEAVTLLLEYEADTNVLDKRNESPLDKVVFCSKNNALILLLWSSANVEKLSKSWSRIVKSADIKMFKHLVEYGLTIGEDDLSYFSDDQKGIVIRHAIETRRVLDLQAGLYPVLADTVRQLLLSQEQWKLSKTLEKDKTT